VSLANGSRLGPYEILYPIGSGGMGEVYRARDTRLGRDVAVKVIHAIDDGRIPDRLPRFEREAQAVAALNHPNILALHDIGNDAGVSYAVTELLEGETLRSRLESAGRLTPIKAIDYAVQIAQGLAAAHERGIVHRDLKPENVFITREGRVKILDFGLAQQAAAAPPSQEFDSRATTFTTGENVVLGTPGYISPEQILGQGATPRSDLFALGVVAYEMLTGIHPFKRETGADTMMAVLREDPPPIGRAAPGLPGGLVKVIERCLDKQAGSRPDSARDVAIFLEAIGISRDDLPAVGGVTLADVNRVRNRLLAISCGVLLLFAAATWGFVNMMADRAVTAAIDADLARVDRLVQRVHRERLSALLLTSRLVASFPELKALFATDAPTIRDYLLSYQQRNPDVPLLAAINPDGHTIARTDEVSVALGDDRLAALSAKPGEPAVVEMRGRPYLAAAASADAGGSVFGYVVGASAVDDAFATALREATQDEIVLLSKNGVLASTLRTGQPPWGSRDEWRRAGGRADGRTDVTIGSQQFAAREVVLAEDPPLSAVVLKSRDDAINPFQRIQLGVLLIGVLCVLVAVGLSYFWYAAVG
jgi:protein kinase-like protein